MKLKKNNRKYLRYLWALPVVALLALGIALQAPAKAGDVGNVIEIKLAASAAEIKDLACSLGLESACVKAAESVVPALGAIPGNVLPRIIDYEGQQVAYYYRNIAASSTLCFYQNPCGATSTIVSANLQITRGVLGANTFDIATSTTDFGSSTPALVFAATIPTGENASFIWQPNSATTSTSVGFGAQNPLLGAGVLPGLADGDVGQSNYILGPSERLVVRVATSSTVAGKGDDSEEGSSVFAAPYQGTCAFGIQRL